MLKKLIGLALLSIVISSCQKSPSVKTPVVVKKDTVLVPADSLPVEVIPTPPLDYDSSQWTELSLLDTAIVLDIRYATTNNFVKEQLYECGRCFLRPEAAVALSKIQRQLQQQGYGLKMFDCFRPLPVQQRLWDKFQNASYVTPPTKGSMHNRGLAVDLTIIDATGRELEMGTEFDFFGKEAHHTYTGHSNVINENRKLLKETMESNGFKGIRTEWWHYSYAGKSYALSSMEWNCDLKH